MYNPLIYEINTWVWLHELSRQCGRAVNLATVPDAEWDAIAGFGFDAVWFMGVWQRSPAGARIAMANGNLVAEFQRTLPDFSASDNVGSAYCIRGYTVDAQLGGPEALSIARSNLAKRGLRLILDFVPNHVAPDHPWANEHPEYFIRATLEDLSRDPQAYVKVGDAVIACGRDPYFPPWQDVLQLNAFFPGLRAAAISTLQEIAAQCDGVRCDMAMLLMNEIFQRTWGPRAGTFPAADYWAEVIPAVRAKHPEFQFIAEAYWDQEWALQQQGFDFCYDKRLYDRLVHDSAEGVRLHLCADMAYQAKLLRFIENHDEPRAAATFQSGQLRAAALLALTLPGARLVHEGQLEGRRVHVPVFLARRPEESPNSELRSFYAQWLQEFQRGQFRQGRWQLCERFGWPGNENYQNLIGWCWDSDATFCIIVVNLSPNGAQGKVRIPLERLRGQTWELRDLLSTGVYHRGGDDMWGGGLFVDLPAWGGHVFVCSAA